MALLQRRVAFSAGSVRPAAAPRPLGRAATRRTQQLSRSVSDAALQADIADLEQRVSDDSGPAGGLPILPSEQVKLRVRMRGYDTRILRDACDQIVAIGRLTGAKIAGPVNLPTKRKIYCVLRSPHVNKDAREHFEVRTHHRLVDLSNLSAQTVEALMEWVPPAGLEVETSIV